jgi:hypothetical protein
MKGIKKLPRISFKQIWDWIEFPSVCLLILVLFIFCLTLTAKEYDAQKGEYPKPMETGLGDAIKTSLVVICFHEYIVTTYTTKTGSGISTIHNQSCKFCTIKKK